MSNYCVAADVHNALNATLLAQLTNDSGTAITDAIIDAAATVVSGVIDTYLVGRYVTPVTGPANILAVLKSVAIPLVIADLMQDRLLLERYPSFKEDHDHAMNWLLAVQAGKWSLPGAALPATSAPQDDSDFAGGYDRVFGPDSSNPNAPNPSTFGNGGLTVL